jgi:hypothetical protein
MKQAPRYLCLLAALFGAGCRLNEPAGVTLRWMPDTLRTVYTPGNSFYCYAPSVIQEDGTDLVFACRNAVSFVIRDRIYYLTQAGRTVNGASLMLAPSKEPGAWDSFHVCDPSVVAGRFRDGRIVYRYAMFYLGNDVDASRNNQIGLALAEKLDGPWRRYGPPIVSDTERGTWGTGQPSAVSLDHNGWVLLFYTVGHRGAAGYVRELDLSDVAHPEVGEEVRLSERGLTRADGGQDWLNNFDVVLDKRRERFIAVRERHPYPTSQPSYIGEQLQVVSLAASDLRRRDAEWQVEGEITPAMTGFARNHNPGIARTVYGELPEPRRLRVFFSSSQAEPALGGQRGLWTYALHEVSAGLQDEH